MYELRLREASCKHALNVHRAVRVAEFKTDRDVFNDDEVSTPGASK